MALWTTSRQAPLSMGLSRHEYWNGLPFPLPGDLSNPRIKPMSPALAGGFVITEPGEPLVTLPRTNISSCCSGDQQSQVGFMGWSQGVGKVAALLEVLGASSFPPLTQGPFISKVHPSKLCIQDHIYFSPPSYKDSGIMGQPSHLMINVNCTCQVPFAM